MNEAFHITYKFARRIVIAVVGSTIVLAGLVMVVTPGPALIVIPIGLGILGIEFAWARRWLRTVRSGISDATSRARGARAEARRRSSMGNPE